MKQLIFLLFLSATTLNIGCAQNKNRPHCENPAFDNMVASLIHASVPLISVQEVYKNPSAFMLLDARESKEFDVSHIQGAKNVGYNDFKIQNIGNLDKNAPIVVYCSIGYRSEKIGELLQTAGFKNVKNLYGSIFEWVNQGYPVVNNENQKTIQIHTYNKPWSFWVKNKKMKKVN